MWMNVIDMTGNNVYIDLAYSEILKELTTKLVEMRIKYKDSEKLDKCKINRFLNKGNKSELDH